MTGPAEQSSGTRVPATPVAIDRRQPRHHLSMMLDLAEHPEGISMGEWAQAYPPHLIRPLLRLACVASDLLAVEGLGEMLDEAAELHDEEMALEVSQAWQELQAATGEWAAALRADPAYRVTEV